MSATKSKSAAKKIGSQHDRAEMSPGFVLWQVTSLWMRDVRDALAPTGITHMQFVLLASAAYLAADAASTDAVVTQSEIATHARVDAVTASEVLRTLEKKKLVKRLANPNDARSRQIVVTAAGNAAAKKTIAVVERVDRAFFGKPGAELQALKRLLSRQKR